MFATIDFWAGAIVIFICVIFYKWLFLKFCTDGTLKIDRHNPSKDVYTIEIDDLDKLSKKKRIILKVSQK